MPIIESEKFKFSSTFYAIDWSALEYKVLKKIVTVTVPAVWFKRQQGETVCCDGWLSDSYNLEVNNLVKGSITDEQILDLFINRFDGRYGGSTVARWNGENLWAPGFSMKEMIAYTAELDKFLTDFLNPATPKQIPAGYSGWYSINGKS